MTNYFAGRLPACLPACSILDIRDRSFEATRPEHPILPKGGTSRYSIYLPIHSTCLSHHYCMTDFAPTDKLDLKKTAPWERQEISSHLLYRAPRAPAASAPNTG